MSLFSIRTGWMSKQLITNQLCFTAFRETNSGSGTIFWENYPEIILNGAAGFTFQNFKIGSVNIDKLNKGRKDELPSVAEEPGLFEVYRDSLGLVSENEADGGWVNTLKAGLV